jgi:hypothetical protein
MPLRHPNDGVRGNEGDKSNDKLVAYGAPKCTELGKPEVMRVRRRAAADKASLPHNELAVIFVA